MSLVLLTRLLLFSDTIGKLELLEVRNLIISEFHKRFEELSAVAYTYSPITREAEEVGSL